MGQNKTRRLSLRHRAVSTMLRQVMILSVGLLVISDAQFKISSAATMSLIKPKIKST